MKCLPVICFCVFLYFSVFCYQKTDAEGHALGFSIMQLVSLLTYSMLSKRVFFLFLTLTEKSFKKEKWQHKYISQDIQ